ncbi:MAG TPA: hypothetical protein PLD25_30820 [Chloroflexota bacterium]|nr:hypothetical protein [Chloroflexota bacterium]
MEQTKLWRSQLFSALGAGFQDDMHLQEGIHLRWSSQPQLGLPLEYEGQATGLYRVYYLQDGFLPLRELDLFALQGNPYYTVYSSLNGGVDTAYHGGSRFYKAINAELSAILFQYFTLVHWLQTGHLSQEEKKLLHYLDGVFQQLQPERYEANWAFEIGEVCAVDAQYSFNLGMKGAYAWVRGYDRHGRMLAEDWVGFDGSTVKTVARLRSPHLYSVRVEPVAGMPAVSQQELRWIFCDDYSRAPIWQESGVERRFHMDEDAYKEEQVIDLYYAPFQVQADWAAVSQQLMMHLAQNEYVEQLPNQPDTYHLSRFSANLATEDPANQQNFPNIQLPVLASLVHAAADPVMANILGLYAWGKPDIFPDKRDYKVEAYLPFFNTDNLVKLRDQVLAMAAAQGIPVTTLELERLSGPEGYTRSTALCGLVLSPEITRQPAPYAPESFTTHITAIDLLSQENPDEAEIYVNGRLHISKPPFDPAPTLQPVSYMVERSLDGEEFANVIEAEDSPDPLDELGILPAVTMPKPIADDRFWELRDDFRLPKVEPTRVQYRLTAFDIFGRPSDPYTGDMAEVPIPCYEPVAATSLTAQVNREQNDLNLELYFAISGTIPPLHATPQLLEITVHPVDPFTAEPVDQIRWPGSLTGRTFIVDYLTDGSFLDVTQLTPGCASLTWAGDQLLRAALLPGHCDADFPLDPTTLSLDVPMSPLLDEGDTGYRLYRLQTKIADVANLPPGLHRWAVRLLIEGIGSDGENILSRDVTTAVQYLLLPPPPAVIQPPLVAIPESTYADRQGDAYYNLDLSQFIPAAIANSNPLVNIYRAHLPHLTAVPDDVVNGDFFAPGGDTLVQSLGRNGRRHFQRVNETPVVYTPETRFYPIPVRGDLEEYHVIGVIGGNAQLDEKDWRQAGIMLFKTPQPVPAPRFQFDSVRTAVVGDKVHITLHYLAACEAELPTGTPPPKVQVMRHDLSTGGVRFAGESVGVWDAAAGGYRFQVVDGRAQQWRRYRYEASLLLHAGKLGQMVKSGQTAACTVLAPEVGGASPFADAPAPTAVAENGHLTLTFPFTAGDFNFSLSKALADNSTVRVTGRLVEGAVLGLTNAGLTVDRSNGRYTLSYLDRDPQPGTYTLRLWQGQKAAWPQKLEV